MYKLTSGVVPLITGCEVAGDTRKLSKVSRVEELGMLELGDNVVGGRGEGGGVTEQKN